MSSHEELWVALCPRCGDALVSHPVDAPRRDAYAARLGGARLTCEACRRGVVWGDAVRWRPACSPEPRPVDA